MPGNTTSANKYNPLTVAFRKETFVKDINILHWQRIIKRLLDIVLALTGLIILLPLLIYVAIRIKVDSRGPVFYFQKRIGRHGIPFMIFKFRSMYKDAEKKGPTLSYPNDARITTWGRTIRKWKMDELPQLLNVLIGDMSLVGPRPERQYYIAKVAETSRCFEYLHQVKPGLTSLGMISFGYAQNIDQIIERTRYDIRYLENYSLLLDFHILLYTLPAIAEGRIFSASLRFSSRAARLRLRPMN